MRLSKKAQFGTRAMLELALQHGRRVIPLSRIAREQEISVKYLEQIFTPLRKAGMVEALRGPSGGYRLTRPPSEISVGEIIRALDESMNPVECLDDSRYCERVARCKAREVWDYLSQAIRNTLDGITLEEILSRQTDGLQGGSGPSRPGAP